MNIDKRILDLVLDMTSSCPGFYEAFIKELETHGKDVNFHLTDFNRIKIAGWCQDPKNIFISHELKETHPFLFTLFVLLHESMHTNHGSWKDACSKDFAGFKEDISKYEEEANGYALGVLERLQSVGFAKDLKHLIFVTNMQINQAKFTFDHQYRPVYDNFGGELCLEHLGEKL